MRSAIFALLFCLALTARAQYFSDWLYLSESELTPANGSISYSSHDHFRGSFHTNGELAIVPGTIPEFNGPVSTSECTTLGIPASQIPWVFPQGFRPGSDRALIPGAAECLVIAEQTETGHRFPGRDADSLQLTTWIQFDQASYHVSQYTQEGVQGPDTSYVLPWETRALPASPGVIWVQGVARIQGVIAGQLTVVASDTLFLTGDLITADTILEPCDDPLTFGTVPLGSPNRIGLIGLSQVLIAATVPNGLGDGATEHEWECSSPCPPVITGCGQERRDVVLTASILALGCGFGVEYWKTTTTPSPDPAPQMYCAGWRDTQAESLDCGQVDTASDLRGAIWLTGSLCTTMHGQWVTQIWWPSTIGYEDRFLRHDPNLLLSPPPFWPELVFEDPDWLEVQLSASGHSWCGLVEDPSAFRDAWNFGVIHLIVNADPHTICDQERLRLEIWQDGQLASHLDTVVTEGRSLNLNPGMPLPEEGTHTLHLELTWDTQVWNRGGELCQWQVDFTDLALDGRARPQAFELAVFPNPFNPGTTVSFNLPARETLRLVVHDLTGRRIRVLELGSREAGPQSVYWDGHSDGGQDAPSGVYFLGIEGGSGRLGVVKALLVR